MNRDEFLGKLQLCYFGDRNAFEEIVSVYDKQKKVKEERDKYKIVLDKIKEILNKMIYEGYAPSSTGSITLYTATGENSEFGTRAKVILELLEEIE